MIFTVRTTVGQERVVIDILHHRIKKKGSCLFFSGDGRS